MFPLDLLNAPLPPIPMVLHCPRCGAQHVDAAEPQSGWDNPPHKSHKCGSCKLVWRPCDLATTGVDKIETRGQVDDDISAYKAMSGARALIYRLRMMIAEGNMSELDAVDREIAAIGMTFVRPKAAPLKLAGAPDELHIPMCAKCGEPGEHPTGCHNHEGNCAWCPTCFDREEGFFVGLCEADRCHVHDEPRGECPECPDCPACDASGGPPAPEVVP